MDTRKPIDAMASALMLILCMIWGLQQVAIKAASTDVAPILQISIRSGLAAILVVLLMVYRKEKIAWSDGTWRPGLIIGAMFTMEFLLVGEALRYTTASHSVVFLYTSPIFSALGLHIKLPSERLKAVQWAGILLAFSGIVITFYGRSAQPVVASSSNILLGDCLALLAGMSWATTTMVIRCSGLGKIPATQTLLYQLVGACVLLLVASLCLKQTTFHATHLAIESILFQTVIVSFGSFLVWFWLLRTYLATRLGVLAFMTPVFGIIFGIVLLNEPVEPKFLVGAVLVFAGVFFVSGYEWIQQLVSCRINKWFSFNRRSM